MFSHWNHLNSEHDQHQMVLDDQSDGWQVCKTADGVTINPGAVEGGGSAGSIRRHSFFTSITKSRPAVCLKPPLLDGNKTRLDSDRWAVKGAVKHVGSTTGEPV